MYSVAQKTAKLFLSELCQISTNYENFWHNDGKGDKLMCGFTHFPPHHLVYVYAPPCKTQMFQIVR